MNSKVSNFFRVFLCTSIAGVAGSVLASTALAQDLNALAGRTILCIKRVGKTVGNSNRGRDAFMNVKSCPKGYFAIDILALSTIKTAGGPAGEQGPQGAVGPQGIPGPGGGSVFGRLISCQEMQGEPVTTPCDIDEASQFKGRSGSHDYEVYTPGNSFSSRPDKSCLFRLTNIPAGTYDLAVGKVGSGRFVKSIKGVVVNEATSTSLGDIPICSDVDDDGFDSMTDCDDYDSEVNPAAAESCSDEQDNNCNGEANEGCASSSSSSSSSSEGSSSDPS